MNNEGLVCYKTGSAITVDGRLDEEVWHKAHKSGRFIDVIGGTPAVYDTKAALLYDDESLYIGFWAEDPFPAASITKRDGLIWFENDIEVFIDGGDCYYEFQINALNTIYEVFYIWRDAYVPGGVYDVPEFDVFKNKALTFGGNHDRTGRYFWKGSHPRGNRWAYLNWDFPGLQTAVHVDGRLNDTSVISKGWTVELRFPFAGMKSLMNGRSLPPKAGDEWRIFMGRYQQMELNGEKVSVGWAVDKIGTDDNHYPEKFTRVRFSGEYAEDR